MKFVHISLALTLAAGAAVAQQKRPLVAVTGMSHESNSFFPSKTTAADFGSLEVRPAADVIRESEKASTMVSGYIAGSRQFGFDLLPGVVAGAQPKGPVTAEAFETIANAIVAELKRVLPKIDGVLMPCMARWWWKATPRATWNSSGVCGRPWARTCRSS